MTPTDRDPVRSPETDTTLIDRILHAGAARLTGGVSTIGLCLAWFDWINHLTISPGRQMELGRLALVEASRLFDAVTADAARTGSPTVADPGDRRFTGPEWDKLPYSAFARGFLSIERFWDEAVRVHGVSERHQALLAFLCRQMLDMAAPTNSVLTNPMILSKVKETGGVNLVYGGLNALDDALTLLTGNGTPADHAKLAIGKDVAMTPGTVVTRTDIAEIIQYTPTTGEVHATPIVIIPAWIMKYYILDLSPENSLVRHLVEQGFTVFMVSWKNPGPEDRDIAFDDYRTRGVMAAIDAATAITGARQVHGVGYCLGGTLLSIAAAAMGRDGDNRLRTLSLFASQTDFHEAGELRLFINDSQLALIDDMMWMRGYLRADEMAGAFHILRSNDLIWSRAIGNYALGEREKPLDIMLWSEDATRMPYRMHSEYLRKLYLENRFAEGQLMVGGRPVVLRDVVAPIFAVGTEWDHVAPWKSVFKIHLAAESDVTFVLTNGGHNAGIVSEPGHPRRHYRIAMQAAHGPYVDPDTWLETAACAEGSWWPAWTRWLDRHAPERTAPPPSGAPDKGYRVLEAAPGLYVHG